MGDVGYGFDGRVVIVVGAGGGGIGTAVSRRLAAAGAVVAAVDVDGERLAAARDVLAADDRHRCFVVDARDRAAVVDLVAEAATLGSVRGLVHIAGGFRLHQWAPLTQLDDPEFDAVVALNFGSAVTTTKAVGAHLVRQGTGGSIVHIATTAALQGMPFGAAYASSKAALLTFMRTAAIEWGSLGIRVNAVAPGTIVTPRNPDDVDAVGADAARADAATIPLRRRGTADEIASGVVFLLSDLASYVTGQVLAVDGGSSIRPGFLDADDIPVFVHDDELRARLRY
jgi:NAD(P)-dependent dehydrogenase (short-subunit alcohol dehydrogenase family)